MKYLKSFNESITYEDIEDNFILLFDNKLIDLNGISLISKGNKPSEFLVDFKFLGNKSLSTIEEIEERIKFYKNIISVVKRMNIRFLINKDDVKVYIPISEKVRNFYKKYAHLRSMIIARSFVFKEFIDIPTYGNITFSVKIDKNLNVVLYTNQPVANRLMRNEDLRNRLISFINDMQLNDEIENVKIDDFNKIYFNIKN
jgi:hypothetical protein